MRRTSAGRRIWRLGTEGTIRHATNGRRKPEESSEWLCRRGDDCQKLAQSCKRSDGSGGRCAGGLASKRPSARSSIPFPWHERPTKGTTDFSATWAGASLRRIWYQLPVLWCDEKANVQEVN